MTSRHTDLIMGMAMAAALALCVSCATHTDTNPAIGKWKGVCDGSEEELTLNDDGSCYGIENGKAHNGTWVQRGGSVTLTFEGEEL